MVNKLDSYPKLTGEILIFSKDQPRLVLFNNKDGSGFNIDGLGAIFASNIDGRTPMRALIENFKNAEGYRVPALELEIERLIGRLEENDLLEFLDSPSDDDERY